MKNKYIYHSKISEAKFREILSSPKNNYYRGLYYECSKRKNITHY